jgi:hypothetical protein
MASGNSLASPLAAGVAALMLSYEGFERLDSPGKVYERMKANYLRGIIGGIPFNTDTPNNFITTGINHPDRQEGCPYAGLKAEECTAINAEKQSDEGKDSIRQRSPV